MKIPQITLLSFFTILTMLSFDSGENSKGNLKVGEVIEKTIASIKASNTMTFTFSKSERINGKMANGSSEIKLENNPFKLYLKTLGPEGGKELLYTTGANGNKAVVKPNSFPYVTLKLDPFGSLLREKQHHTIFEIGFTYFGKIMTAYSQKINFKYKDYCVIDGDIEWQGRKCISVTCNYPSFAWTSYTVKTDETLTSIAKRLLISDYMMLEKNNATVDDYDDLDEDEVIKIPNLYCKKITFYVDKENFLPIRQLIYDDVGLFEEYQYLKLVTP
ncbi:MAG: DUF1571 domain-containing protein [Bacteroidetes bacterium]|nr:DUF1571 domain-containing protein [Bacteroidota bacterium]